MARDYYGILGVDRNATDSEIKKAFRRKARQYHPDINDTPEAAEKFNELKIAEEVLTNPEKRRIVDAGGDPEAGPQMGGAGGAGFGDINDLLNQFFAGGMGGMGTQGPQQRVRRGNDALIHTELSLEDAFSGVVKDFTLDTAVICESCHGQGSADGADPIDCPSCGGHGQVRASNGLFLSIRDCARCEGTGKIFAHPCETCHGDGRMKKRVSKTVRIPAGVRNGTRVRLEGQGEVGPGGGPAGDLYVECHIKEHEFFARNNDDLYLHLRVPMVDAALGGTAEVPLIEGGTTEFDIPAGTQHGDTAVIRDAGMPSLRTAGKRGNLILELEVVIPKNLDARSKEHLRKIRKARSNDRPEVVGRGGMGMGDFFGRLRRKLRRND